MILCKNDYQVCLFPHHAHHITVSLPHSPTADSTRLRGLPETVETCLEAPSPITALKFSHGGTMLATGCRNGDVYLWSWATRGIARSLTGSHSLPICDLVWSDDNRQVLSASEDGSVVIWNTASAHKIEKIDLGCGAITSISPAPSSSSSSSLLTSYMIVCYKNNESEILILQSIIKSNGGTFNKKVVERSRLPVPVMAMASSGTAAEGGRMVTGKAAIAATPPGGHRAIFLPLPAAATNNDNIAAKIKSKTYMVVSAARGVMLLLSFSERTGIHTNTNTPTPWHVVNAVKLSSGNAPPPEQVTGLQYNAKEDLLLMNCNDKNARIFRYHYEETLVGVRSRKGKEMTAMSLRKGKERKATPKAAALLQKEPNVKKEDVEVTAKTVEQLAEDWNANANINGKSIKKELGDQTFHTAAAQTHPPALELIRVFNAQVEREVWGVSALSPDGRHLVTALRSREEHILYTWNIPYGYPENALQAGSDGVVALEWHPGKVPMQLVAVGGISGKMYLWAKVMTQDWSAFAPDFETLRDNREHVEEETEFDVGGGVDVNGNEVGEGEEDSSNEGEEMEEEGQEKEIDIVDDDDEEDDDDSDDNSDEDEEEDGYRLKYLPVLMPPALGEGEEAEEMDIDGDTSGNVGAKRKK